MCSVVKMVKVIRVARMIENLKSGNCALVLINDTTFLKFFRQLL